MDEDLKALITQLAEAEDRSFAWLSEVLLREALKARGHLKATDKRRS
jgi:hypothetical protein